MREYRRRKRVGQMGAPAFLPSTLTIMRAPEPLGVLRPIQCPFVEQKLHESVIVLYGGPKTTTT
jgi:hypothetical protein